MLNKSSSKLEDAQRAVGQCLVMNNLPPSIMNNYYFKNMLNKLSEVEPGGYRHIDRKEWGMDKGKLGSFIQKELDMSKEKRLQFLQKVNKVGGTLCSDGAKNRKRSCLNSILVSRHGSYVAQSTDATGITKTAQYIYNDVLSAIKNIGEENVFMVTMDGACKKTLRMIDENYPKIFAQRCTTHGCNLLCADIGIIVYMFIFLSTNKLHYSFLIYICRKLF